MLDRTGWRQSNGWQAEADQSSHCCCRPVLSGIEQRPDNEIRILPTPCSCRCHQGSLETLDIAMQDTYQILVHTHLPGWRCVISTASDEGCYFWAVRSPIGNSSWSAIAPVTWAEQAISFGPLPNDEGYVACGQWGEYLWECHYEPDIERLYWRRDDGLEVNSEDIEWGDRPGVEAILRELESLFSCRSGSELDSTPDPSPDLPSESD